MALKWYVVHAYSNFEKKVKSALEDRIKLNGLEDKFGKILVPTEEIVEMKEGKKRSSERKFFPGYVLVEMELDDETWHLVKEVPKVLGFIGGSSDRPAPISEKEANFRFLTGSKKVSTSRGRRFSSSRARLFGWSMGHSMISVVLSRTLITIRASCVLPSRFLGVRHRSSWNLPRSKRVRNIGVRNQADINGEPDGACTRRGEKWQRKLKHI